MRVPITNEKGQYRCPQCKEFKDLSEFYAPPPSHRGPKYQLCKPCCVTRNYWQRYKKRIKDIGPDAFLQELNAEQKLLQEKFKLLAAHKKKGT